ncbi:flagellar transcriptional regulator FlhD [Trinickia caryophylli]|uniref:Flagellar transcriptional activator FlhD n=1 Tax=Trinickia caryophylli TaxID=28094 RepID=A0A1X7DMT4_TRICW|nr:flagellar transcriptional regulator FlhD [Trinickia caryophylli]PMS10655.1 flagellar transcriptional activator FlhD [Trinickia caryophylli]TRX17160.1 flagellar transcriptional activator FlhD [Trinickia caryophylli]WQE12106.1 flagellar transcriptional regulator FlhD [Trinickia caryophylli]SMF18061.1 flagellar transcriptional activator FlhD [Trinickia caryophylli]GLU31766.1 hypothetical protein Busp01_16080 [Trinickia caryophylli]
MNSCDTSESIREINMSYLSLVQRMLRENRESGIEVLGISAPVADLLTGLSQAQALKLASRDQLICFFRFNDHAVLGGLGAPATAAPVVQDALLAAAA